MCSSDLSVQSNSTKLRICSSVSQSGVTVQQSLIGRAPVISEPTYDADQGQLWLPRILEVVIGIRQELVHFGQAARYISESRHVVRDLCGGGEITPAQVKHLDHHQV